MPHEAGDTDTRMVAIIKANKDKYSISVMCKILKIVEITMELDKKRYQVSRRIIGSIMKKHSLASNKMFLNFEELEYLLSDYVSLYNNHRIHGSLNYLTPVEYRI